MFTYVVVVLDVHDGDTVHLDIDLGFRTWRRGERYRLARINAPELAVLPGGPAARDALAAKLAAAKVVTATTSKADNYGRYLVELVADGVNVNDWMLTNAYAVPYP